jgi:hypothetical protein
MESERLGGCECGELRYAISGEPVVTVACHCTQCQRQSGSAFGMTMVVRTDAFRWLSGRAQVFVTKADSGTRKECVFCGRCGIRIYNALGESPAGFNMKPGTLDDTAWFSPALQVWIASKQPWVSLLENIPSFDHNPG